MRLEAREAGDGEEYSIVHPARPWTLAVFNSRTVAYDRGLVKRQKVPDGTRGAYNWQGGAEIEFDVCIHGPSAREAP